MRKISILLSVLFCINLSWAQVDDQKVMDYLKRTLAFSLEQKETRLAQWREKYTKVQDKDTENMIELLGYQPPDFLVGIAEISAFLYQKTGEIEYAKATRDLLVSLEGYRKYFPERFRHRVEYKNGVPVVNWFRTLPRFCECFWKTKDAGVYSKKDIEKIKESVAASVDVIFAFPEWGAMNRAMLRAESFTAAYITFPDHPHAKKWKKMAEILANDSIGKWEIEDAQIYHPVWLRPYINYLDMTGKTHLFQSPVMKFYFDYFISLLAPHGNIPEFGDGRWQGNPAEYYLVLERGAKEYHSGEMKWAAQRIFEKLTQKFNEKNPEQPFSAWDTPDLGFADLLVRSDAYLDKNIEPVEPGFLSGDALEEVITKKIVFRSDWSPDATYLLLNYKDEGYYSIRQKNYLKHILAVEEEKMHHGHSDENSICLLMKNGSVLLSDGNYREVAPSGEFGAFRADIFHNRLVVRNVKKYLTQPYFSVLRNSGAYNDNVRTAKIDFQIFPEVEYSRTRLEDPKTGYRWDRIIVRHKKDDYFIVTDAVKFFRSDYFTLANLFHTRQIVQKGKNWFVTRIDKLAGKFPNAGNMDLLIIFPQDKFIGTEKEHRDLQEEIAIFQGTSQFYDMGKVESFVTILVPIQRGENPEPIVKRFSLTRDDMAGLGLKIKFSGRNEEFGFKLDLDRDLLKEEIRPRYNYESGKIDYGNVETDADMFFVNLSGREPRFCATNLVKFVMKDRVLFDTPESQFFQVWGKSDRKGRAKWRSWNNY